MYFPILLALIVSILVLTWTFPGLLLNLNKKGSPKGAPVSLTKDKKYIKSMVEQIYNMKFLWTDHNVVLKTLGEASYLLKDKKHRLEDNNAMLRSNFPLLYDHILAYFQEKYPQWRVKYRPTAPLPGFHIFRTEKNGWFSWPVASLHVDRQYQHVDFKPSEKPDYKNTISFTIPLQIPEGGTGLHIWDATSEQRPWYATLGGPGLAWWLNTKRHTYIDYAVPGQIVEHNGNKFHMISPTDAEATKDRITVQGHGVYTKKSNTLWLYW
jgi:hypothetical protein